MFTIRQKIVNELKSEINWRIFEVGVFSRGVPINQFQVLFTSCIDICLQVLQVGTRCHLFTSWYMLSLCGHLFTSWYTLSLCGHLFTSWYTLSLCGHLFTSCYNVLQVHVSPRSEVTFGNDVIHRNSTAKTGSKVSLYTTDVKDLILENIECSS